ncbi:hypothetical protein [uncultured Psychroserpens sp.]|uniref:hypothetical protein n=1 Tax=uncultured Psychroserpens sp. TaxID=255436 RepID=UPI00261E55E9|nr:hypothetical protein [uncultured Psychroserpens sp.]
MQKNVDEHIEKLIHKAMKDSSLETPSIDFTKHVMQGVIQKEKSVVTTYQPLISKTVWTWISIAVIGAFIYLMLGNQTNGMNWFGDLNLESITQNGFFDVLSKVTISQTVMYTLLLFVIMLYIQIPLLKHHFDKRLKL